MGPFRYIEQEGVSYVRLELGESEDDPDAIMVTLSIAA